MDNKLKNISDATFQNITANGTIEMTEERFYQAVMKMRMPILKDYKDWFYENYETEPMLHDFYIEQYL